MMVFHNKISLTIVTMLVFSFSASAVAENDDLTVEGEDLDLEIMEGSVVGDLLNLTEDDTEIQLLADDEEFLIIDQVESSGFEEGSDNYLEGLGVSSDMPTETNSSEKDQDSFSSITTFSSAPSFKVDKLWIEYGQFIQSHSTKNNQGYGHSRATFDWLPLLKWELKVSIRADAYFEKGRDDWSDIDFDYDESYIRYKGEVSTVTLGAQKILWGRIDEFPPTDRLSTQDIRRFIIDDLEDRRLASLALRLEHFFGDKKLDLAFYPNFREAQLADKDSTWHPVNRQSGEILGLKTNAAVEAVVKGAAVQEDPPDSEGGFGLRFSSIGSDLDYALSLQKGRQTLPYFSYKPATNTIEGEYPHSWIVGGDMGFEAVGGTVKFEASWLSDTPVTRKDGRYTTVESFNWGAALELFPGDGDARLNLQLTASKLISSLSVMDRDESYTFNGSYETPFDNNNWRLKARFNVGLDEKDIYFNPEIAFTAWESQELYLEAHFFDGDKGTPGGFYEDNSLLTFGWRIKL